MPGGAVVLDLIRNGLHLTGTREGCREGDCGACTVLIGTPLAEGVSYRAVNSCLLPVAELRGRHLVTIEGLTPEGGLSIVQKAFVDLGASQCGFCTPGMIVSMTGYLLSTLEPTGKGAADALGGNICRCTGYAAVRRAAEETVRCIGPSPACSSSSPAHLEFLVEKGVLPEYFPGISSRIGELDTGGTVNSDARPVRLAGGTDLFAVRAGELREMPLELLCRDPSLRGIRREEGSTVLGAAVTVTELVESRVLRPYGDFHDSLDLVSSTQIRNRATLGGNIVNASPIGDLTVMLMPLGAELLLRSEAGAARTLPLHRFFLGYRKLDMREDELLESVRLPAPDPGILCSFEKVSMRRHMDIASVNSAALFVLSGDTIVSAEISAGGVAPVPMLLANTSRAIAGRTLSAETAGTAAMAAMEEVSPIDDVRGSAEYKRKLLGRLVRAHFLKVRPELGREALP
ncbi:MAG: hypothetical protein AVO35_09500 [Candidatus Aegiribacteria sp. MLS_C]|nr:MAG: hypothetical protein AVO35_09500 [Candidatus Aegiribacteria sp. MLS_C]